MLAVRTPGAPLTARIGAAFDSAFPFGRQGRLLRSRSISGLFSRSLHSGLQPPCLRFATAVTGRHARLGSRLLARLCRGRHLRRQTSTRFQGATPTPPYIPVRIRRFARLSANGFFASAPEAQMVASSCWLRLLRAAPSGLHPFPPLRKPVTWMFSRHGHREIPTPKRLSSVQAFSETPFACRVGGGAH